jgi:hypothetical protein
VGNGLTLGTHEDDPAKAARTGGQFVASVDYYYQAKTIDSRAFVHIPEVAAGQSVRIPFHVPKSIRTPADLPTYSLWSDEGSVEGQPTGGFDEFRAQVAKNARAYAAKKQAREKPSARRVTPRSRRD